MCSYDQLIELLLIVIHNIVQYGSIKLLGWNVSPVVFYHYLTLRDTT